MAETPWSWVVYENNALKPFAKFDLDLLAEKYKPGTRLRAKFAQTRSPAHHRLYWGVLRKVNEMTDLWPNAEALHEAVKIHLRMFGPGVRLLGGGIRFETQSIKFDSMDQGAFRIFFDQAMRAVEETTCIEIQEVIEMVKHEVGWTVEDERKLAMAA